MIRWLLKWVKRLLLVAILLIAALLAPVGYVEVACRGGETVASDYTSLLPEEWHRAEGRTLMTYPEWHIVHAYDDYGQVITEADPHDFGYFRAVGGFWGSLCALSEASPPHGGFDWTTKQTIYVIGVSFTAELMLKAAYEETIGRFYTWRRGPEHTVLDDLSARQARDYAAFLQQTPWYKWDFKADIAEQAAASEGTPRDNERRLALGLEFSAKSAYAGVIEQAVAGVGADALRLRMVVQADPADIEGLDGVELVETRPEGLVLETPRYRALTGLMQEMAGRGVDFVEIAGNDNIMLTALAPAPLDGALYARTRQGYGDTRSLMLMKVADLAAFLRENGDRVEHVHDY
ncbi:hypothetical protein [Oceanicola sp. 502str15]|uniref:hypothetical protein n=1 Tax=Oceanicola sp. 502str15 TaxID=2696061 RepID=UPI002095A98B|nr:hypothetical protein [Oceanicola sp. 502str15]